MKIALCIIVKNEAFFIEEWLKYHIFIGVDTIFVYDNQSTDQTSSIIRKFNDEYDVRFLSWPDTSDRYQLYAYDHCIRNWGPEFDWMGFLDADEFLSIMGSRTIQDMLRPIDDAAGVAINWAVFGSSGHLVSPPGLVIENYIHRSCEEFEPNRQFKCFIKPCQFISCVNPHIFDIKGYYRFANGTPLRYPSLGKSTELPDFSYATINHYFVKSYSDWLVKLKRGYHDTVRHVDIFHIYDRNEVFDPSLRRFAHSLKS